MKIDAVSVTSTDMKASVAFYSQLGFNFSEIKDGEDHIEAITKPGEIRLMIDNAELIESITSVKPVPSSHSTFAILCDSPAEVDAVAKKVQDAGFTVVKEPWDAFWGQRYAIAKDPDGYLVDLFAAL